MVVLLNWAGAGSFRIDLLALFGSICTPRAKGIFAMQENGPKLYVYGAGSVKNG
jgi:hypothetical protein